MVWCCMVWYGVVWCGVVWYGMVWYSVVWYGVVWYGMEWCGMEWDGKGWHGVIYVMVHVHRLWCMVCLRYGMIINYTYRLVVYENYSDVHFVYILVSATFPWNSLH